MKSPEIAGIPLLPTTLSLTGGALAIHGAQQPSSRRGLTELAIGRSLDLLDGPVARRLDQTSDFGAALDATTDKVAGAALLLGEWRQRIAPRSALLAIGLQNTVNSLATYVAQSRETEQPLAPTRDGKRAMFLQNVALGAYALGKTIEATQPRSGQALRYLGHAAAIVGTGYYGVRASAQYIRRARHAGAAKSTTDKTPRHRV